MKQNIKNKKGEFIITLIIIFTLLLIIFLSLNKNITNIDIKGEYSEPKIQAQEINYQLQNSQTTDSEQKVVYLSDIKYDSSRLSEKSTVGWKSITMNSNLEGQNNGLIALMIDKNNDGNLEKKLFLKGISAHANSQVIFDVSEYVAKGYTKFSTYYGVDASRGSSGKPVQFKITTKTSPEASWKAELGLTSKMKGNSKAGYIEIDLTGKQFIKLEAYAYEGNTSAHACYGSAKLYKEGYTESEEKVDFIKTIDEYDTIIKNNYSTNKFNLTPEYELALLQRELVSKTGYDVLQQYATLSTDNLNTVRWLMTDVENLREYLIGGKPSGGSYFKSLDVLKRLYKERGADLNDTTEITTTRGPSTLGKMYRTMMLSISLTHSGSVYLWINGANQSDPINRYDIYKRLYHGTVEADATTTKGIGNNLIEKNKFASLHVEEMRWVMNAIIDDEEIEWLNWYVREKKNGATGPYSFIRYTFGYNYNLDKYYSEENREAWTTKYNLSNGDKWNVTYGKKGSPKLWIVFEQGSVCGGLSKTGSCVWASYKGLPTSCVSQPAHCAYIYYNQNAKGEGVWGLGNDVGGWHQAGRTEHLNERMPLGWGNQPYIDFNKDWLGMATYVLIAQGALNQYDNLVKSQELLMLANVYNNDLEKLYEIYDEALRVLPINLDAWYGKIKAYRRDETKTDEDYYELAEGIFENLKFYPLPMYHIAREVQKNLKTPTYQFKFTLDQTKTLTYAQANSNKSIQASAVKQEATHLLGQYDKQLATFSFDGANAGAIKLGQRFDGSDVGWDFSLDGKQTWIQAANAYEAGKHIQKLTDEQLNSITSTNDIYVHIIGVDYSEGNLYKIDITEQSALTNIYANDLENRVIGVNLTTEWRYEGTEAWTSYSKESPDLTGNKKVQIRQAPTGTKLASAASEIYTFTEDNQPDTRKYIPVAHLSVGGYSTQSKDSKRPYYAPNAIDGNLNTLWHTDFAINVLQQETKPFYIIKLDEPRYISALEFIQKKYPNKPSDPDGIKNVRVYVSMDGENWEEAGKIENCSTYGILYDITFEKSVCGKYVKLEMDTYNMFASLAMVNLYEDITKIDEIKPIAGIAYSTTETTNEPVVARLVNPSTSITVTNNDGKDSYIFVENGEFTFEFVDQKGRKGSATAKVDWIDKSGPTTDIDYRLGDDKKLIAILDNISEDVYLLNENNEKTNYIEVENGKVISISFLDENGEVYKISEINEKKFTKKIKYKNTTGELEQIKYYEVTFKEDENGNVLDEVESRKGINENGEIVELSEDDINKLKALETQRSNPLEFYLEDNQAYTFKLLDKASNITYKTIKVDYIQNDTKILASDITYSTTMITKEDVIATIKTFVISKDGKECAKVINNNGSEIYTFTKNDRFTFEYVDCATDIDDTDKEVKSHTAIVDWIDKEAPTAKIKYSIESSTDQPVTVTLVDESEEIIITNNGGQREYTFTKNGEFTFRFVDKAGNEGRVTATVSWIKQDEEILIGDINQDGKIGATDILYLKRHIIAVKLGEEKKEWLLTENKFKAGDINQDGEITATDLLLMKRLLLKQSKTH